MTEVELNRTDLMVCNLLLSGIDTVLILTVFHSGQYLPPQAGNYFCIHSE